VYLQRQRRDGVDSAGRPVSKSFTGAAIELDFILHRHSSRWDSIVRDGFNKADEAGAVGTFGVKDIGG
jgi:hypothetical protein